MLNQTIHNEAAGELGDSWASLKHVPNNASLTTIQELIDAIDNPSESK